MTLALDVARYREPSWYERERATVWSDEWLMFCAESEVAANGAYVSAEMAGFPLVVARRPDGALVAFVNVCPHRAGPILWPGEGITGNLVCRYHGWAFDCEVSSCRRAISGTRPTSARSRVLCASSTSTRGAEWSSCDSRPADRVSGTLSVACPPWSLDTRSTDSVSSGA